MATGVLPKAPAPIVRPGPTSTPGNAKSKVLIGGPLHEPCTICGEPGPHVQYFYLAGQVVSVHAACDALWNQVKGEDNMKIRDLDRRGSSPYPVLAWPPAWGSSDTQGDRLAGSYDGVLESVERVDDGLRLTIKYDGREYKGILAWEPGPSIEAVASVLRANLGLPIGALGDLAI